MLLEQGLYFPLKRKSMTSQSFDRKRPASDHFQIIRFSLEVNSLHEHDQNKLCGLCISLSVYLDIFMIYPCLLEPMKSDKGTFASLSYKFSHKHDIISSILHMKPLRSVCTR